MDYTAQVDNYCERTDFTFWSEPVNAVTNAAFLIAAFVAWRLVRGDRGAQLLVVILTCIGIGSFLFHTYATRWALATDVLPIQAFILVYLYLATYRFFGAPRWAAGLVTAGFIPYAIAVGWVLEPIVGTLNGSLAYVPVPILIAGYGLVLLRSVPATGRGLLIGAGILVVSLTFRTIDEAVCEVVPLGTHFLWHCLNGLMLGWMIVVMYRHRRPLPA